MKRMTGKQERKARPRINLEKEGRKRASAESYTLGSYRASAREDHTGSRAILWLTETDGRTHICLMDASIHVVVGKIIRANLDSRTAWRWVRNRYGFEKTCAPKTASSDGWNRFGNCH